MSKGLIERSTIQEIADAIREKNSSSDKYLPAEMAPAIRAISGGADQSAITFDITNSQVTAFVAAARSAYANNDNVSIAADYKEAGTTPTSGSVSASGTVETSYADGKTVKETASGTYALKHFSPNGGRVSLRGSNGNTVWSRLVQPTGTVRFLDLNATRNARDLGGWPCDGGTVKYGMLYRMTVPNGQDADILLNRLGIRHQFDLRGQSGSQNAAFPVPHYHVYDGYIQYTKKIGNGDYDSILRQVVEDVIDAVVAGEPLLFHCSMGCDRTGTLAFYLEGILGMSDVDIDIEYELSSLFDDKNSGTEYYYRYRTDNRVTNETDWVGLKNLVSGYSGSTISARIISYLLSIGLSAARLNAFRSAMIDGNPSTITAPTYTVTNTLTGCATSNAAATAEMQQPYTATITANAGYKLDGATVSITMGGVDITESAYSNGAISIASVTGNLVIAVTAVEETPLKELFDPAAATLNQRFSSSGSYSSLDGNFCSDFIPVSGLDEQGPWRIHIRDTSNDTKFRASASQESILFCKSDKSVINANYGRLTVTTNASGTNTLCKHNDSNGGVYIDINQTGDGNFIPSTFFDLSQVAYIRVCMAYSSGTAIPDTATLANVSIKADKITQDQTTTHVITNTLTNCTTSNAASSATGGESYAATVTADSGYTLEGASVSITMGGVDITSSVYSNGVISIPSVFGDVAINISAVAEAPTNLFDATDADVVLRGRINSSGAAVAYADGQLVTGYIPAAVGDTFVIETDKSLKTNGYTGDASCYSASKEYIAQCTNGSSTVWTFTDSDMTGTFTVPSNLNSKDYSATAFVRFCIAYTDISSIKIYKN